jgi:hypothetical protein
VKIRAKSRRYRDIPNSQRGEGSYQLDKEIKHISIGQEFSVEAISIGDVHEYFCRLQGDTYMCAFPVSLFEVIDGQVPTHWTMSIEKATKRQLVPDIVFAPKAWRLPTFHAFAEKLIDDDPEALRLFAARFG